MKNLYMFIVLLLFLNSSTAQQLQNARWYFGITAGLSFLPNPVAPVPLAGSVMSEDESAASVSDTSGNLLFYTNGTTVWNRTHNPMPNGSGLFGGPSNTQGSVIVPKPGDPDNYYLITIDGWTGNMQGLYYSEIDMALSSGNGDIVTGRKNLLLNDYSGTAVISGYNNASEKLTSTIHSNGIDYWVITQLRNRLHVYSVTSTGITYSSNTTAPVTINGSNGIGAMKISPNTQRIGIAYQRGTATNSNSVLVFGSFNNTTGVVTLDPTTIILPDNNLNGLEFSPNSQNLYFTRVSTGVFCTTGPTAPIQTVFNTGSGFFGLQRAVNNRIYMATSGSQLSVINNPDNLSSPGYVHNTIGVGGGISSGLTLPQWVWLHDINCGNLYLATELNTNMLYNYKYGITTFGTYVVNPGSEIRMRAQGFVQLNGNTYIQPGANFYAGYESCYIQPRMNMAGELEEESHLMEEVVKKPFSVYPNPSDNIVNIELIDGQMQHITIVSLDGKIVADRDINKTANYTFDVKELSGGIYVISIFASDGKVYTEKLVVQ